MSKQRQKNKSYFSLIWESCELKSKVKSVKWDVEKKDPKTITNWKKQKHL